MQCGIFHIADETRQLLWRQRLTASWRCGHRVTDWSASSQWLDFQSFECFGTLCVKSSEDDARVPWLKKGPEKQQHESKKQLQEPVSLLKSLKTLVWFWLYPELLDSTPALNITRGGNIFLLLAISALTVVCMMPEVWLDCVNRTAFRSTMPRRGGTQAPWWPLLAGPGPWSTGFSGPACFSIRSAWSWSSWSSLDPSQPYWPLLWSASQVGVIRQGRK